MKTTLMALVAMFSTFTITAAPINVDLSLECTVSGTKVNGEKSPKSFLEKFRVVKNETIKKNKDGKDETWGVSHTEYVSDGKKYEVSTVDISPDHAVIALTSVVGAGYNRKLLVFAYIIDLKALELERVVTSVPAGSDERSRSTCNKV